MSAPRNLLTEWSSLLLGSLADAGVRHVVLSPGSRSTPLVIAASELAARGALRVHDVIDERAAAFHALGIGKTTGRPALLLCTSGTAGAHYLPAIIEAGLSYAPLLALTADRPFELQGCAAPQTIDQLKLFGDHARAFFELGLPDESEGALRALRRIAAQAVAATLAPVPGAVHINARARKPLEPPLAAEETPDEIRLRTSARQIAGTAIPRVFAPRLAPDPRAVEELAVACVESRRGVILAGPASMSQAAHRAELFALCRATGFPLLAEAASQLRFVAPEERDGVVAIDGFEPLLQSRALREAAAPDLVIQLGAPMTSGAVDAWLEAHPTCQRWILAPHGWSDPSSRAAAHVRADIAETARALVERLAAAGAGSRASSAWASALASAQEVVHSEVGALLRAQRAASPSLFTEADAVIATTEAVPGNSVLALGNSLPIREVDLLCPGRAARFDVWSQRGANGIDGLISGAAGVARAGRPTTLLVGDVSALHDLGGLGAARGLETSLVIVVLNNGGGRIFDQLAIGARSDLAPHLAHFTTPHQLSLEPAARLFGHGYHLVENAGALREAMSAAHTRAGCTLIEARVAPESAAVLARQIRERMDALFAERPEMIEAVKR